MLFKFWHKLFRIAPHNYISSMSSKARVLLIVYQVLSLLLK